MDREPSPRIVLGETDPDGFVRFLLEAQGLAVVGLASSDDELRRVLRGVRPSVVVLDAGITAEAALEVRENFPDTSLVVVWPAGVAAVLAHQRVDPDDAVEKLGDAVRRAAERAARSEATSTWRSTPDEVPPHIRAVLGETADAVDVVPEPVDAPSVAPASTRRRYALPVTAGVWFLYLIVATAIAVAVPGAIDLYQRSHVPRQDAPRTSVPVDRSPTSAEPSDGGRGDATRPDRPKDDEVNGMSARQCRNGGADDGLPKNRQGRGDTLHACSTGGKNGQVPHGPPDEPGDRGQGHGHGPGGHSDSHAHDNGQGHDRGKERDQGRAKDPGEHHGSAGHGVDHGQDPGRHGAGQGAERGSDRDADDRG